MENKSITNSNLIGKNIKIDYKKKREEDLVASVELGTVVEIAEYKICIPECFYKFY